MAAQTKTVRDTLLGDGQQFIKLLGCLQSIAEDSRLPTCYEVNVFLKLIDFLKQCYHQKNDPQNLLSSEKSIYDERHNPKHYPNDNVHINEWWKTRCEYFYEAFNSQHAKESTNSPDLRLLLEIELALRFICRSHDEHTNPLNLQRLCPLPGLVTSNKKRQFESPTGVNTSFWNDDSNGSIQGTTLYQ